MSRAFRVFLAIYAAAMIAVAVGHYIQMGSQREFSALWCLTGSSAFFYLALALGYLLSKDREPAPAPPWLVILFVSVLSLPWSALPSETPIVPTNIRFTAILTVLVLAYLALIVFLLRDFRSDQVGPWTRARRVLVPSSLIAGAGLVFSSLFLKITDSGGTGWNVVTRKAPWITSDVNVGTGIFGPRIEWLQWIYAPGGYLLYVLGLGATIVMLAWLAAARLSLKRFRESAIAAWAAVIISLTSLWVITDIFWGWHFDLSRVPWAAVVASGLWLAGPLFGIVLLVPFGWRESEAWRLRALLLFQIPVAVFNFVMLRAYYDYLGQDSLHMPGLGMLIIGLQIESWACMDMLALRRT